MIKRLSLGGRLRMAAACPDANAQLLAEAADAIEQHEAFRQEVSDAAQEYAEAAYCMGWEGFDRFIIPKPKLDPLAQVLGSFDGTLWEPEDVSRFHAALEARGLEIREKNDG